MDPIKLKRQYLNCLQLDIDGNLVYCLRPFNKKLKYSLNDISNFKDDAFKLFSYGITCKDCKFYNPSENFYEESHQFPMLDIK